MYSYVKTKLHLPTWIIPPAPRGPKVSFLCELWRAVVCDLAQGGGSAENTLSLWPFLSFRGKPYYSLTIDIFPFSDYFPKGATKAPKVSIFSEGMSYAIRGEK